MFGKFIRTDGSNATRCSCSLISFGTPMIMCEVKVISDKWTWNQLNHFGLLTSSLN